MDLLTASHPFATAGAIITWSGQLVTFIRILNENSALANIVSKRTLIENSSFCAKKWVNSHIFVDRSSLSGCSTPPLPDTCNPPKVNKVFSYIPASVSKSPNLMIFVVHIWILIFKQQKNLRCAANLTWAALLGLCATGALGGNILISTVVL